MENKALLRQALEALECFADRTVWPVNDAIAKLRAALGEASDSYGSDDPLYPAALQYVYSTPTVSMEGMLRELRCGYGRISKLMAAMEEAGVLVRIKTPPWWEVVPPTQLKVVNGKN